MSLNGRLFLFFFKIPVDHDNNIFTASPSSRDAGMVFDRIEKEKEKQLFRARVG